MENNLNKENIILNEEENLIKVKKRVSRKYQYINKNLNRKMELLGQQIRKIRKQRGISIVQFAKELDVSRPFIYDLENGLPTVSLYYYMLASQILNCELKIAIDVYEDKK